MSEIKVQVLAYCPFCKSIYVERKIIGGTPVYTDHASSCPNCNGYSKSRHKKSWTTKLKDLVKRMTA